MIGVMKTLSHAGVPLLPPRRRPERDFSSVFQYIGKRRALQSGFFFFRRAERPGKKPLGAAQK
ncbi:MAG TPA: hypothetical protein H9682_00630 [Firmicutes bacterium]|nr:hypothetical protein [Bacillota bacterium]